LLLLGCVYVIAPSDKSNPIPAKAPPLVHKWHLVWQDEFHYTGLPDPHKWGYEVGFVRNHELQYYTDHKAKNARVQNGLLIIETRKESFKGAAYTSASLTTRDRKSFLYGRIEIRAKLPTGVGMWPAIFLLGSNYNSVGWPACGEIDIMENVGYEPESIYAGVQTNTFNWVLGKNQRASTSVCSPSKGFHVYAVEWHPDRIDFFVDDHKFFTFANDGNGWENWPFDKAHYLIINAAVGGNWGGKKGVDDSIFPQRYYIDYVRAYKRITSDPDQRG
jgi:beta-glucanase (GH16 family)